MSSKVNTPSASNAEQPKLSFAQVLAAGNNSKTSTNNQLSAESKSDTTMNTTPVNVSIVPVKTSETKQGSSSSSTTSSTSSTAASSTCTSASDNTSPTPAESKAWKDINHITSTITTAKSTTTISATHHDVLSSPLSSVEASPVSPSVDTPKSASDTSTKLPDKWKKFDVNITFPKLKNASYSSVLTSSTTSQVKLPNTSEKEESNENQSVTSSVTTSTTSGGASFSASNIAISNKQSTDPEVSTSLNMNENVDAESTVTTNQNKKSTRDNQPKNQGEETAEQPPPSVSSTNVTTPSSTTTTTNINTDATPASPKKKPSNKKSHKGPTNNANSQSKNTTSRKNNKTTKQSKNANSTKNKNKQRSNKSKSNNNNNNKSKKNTLGSNKNNHKLTKKMIAGAVTQVEYFFTTNELVRNVFLRKQMDVEGYLPAAIVFNFPSVLSYNVPYYDLLTAIDQTSTLVDVDMVNECLRIQGGEEKYKQWLFPNEVDGGLGCPKWIKQQPEEEEAGMMEDSSSDIPTTSCSSDDKVDVPNKMVECSKDTTTSSSVKISTGDTAAGDNTNEASSTPDMELTDSCSDTDQTDGDNGQE